MISSSAEAGRNQRQPYFVIRKARLCGCRCGGYHTLQALFEVFAGSLRQLLAGRSPGCRHGSSPWSELDLKSRMASDLAIPPAAMLQVRGDWEWLTQCFRLRSFNSDNFCWMCQATLSQGERCFHNFSAEAPHRDTLISHEDYLAGCAQEAVQPSNLFKCPGVLLEHLCVDSMHAGDLGTFQDAIGSLFWIEISHKPWHRNQRTGLLRLNADLKRYYAANKDLKLSSIYPIVLSQIKGDQNKTKHPVCDTRRQSTWRREGDHIGVKSMVKGDGDHHCETRKLGGRGRPTLALCMRTQIAF